MGIFGSLNALLKADSTQWKKGFGEARDEVDKTGKKTKSFFAELKGSFGKSSTLGQSLKLMAGGGAVGALNAAGRELKEFTAGIVDMKAQLQSGEITTGEFTEKLMTSIPVLGQFWQAGRNIREMITGEEAAMKKEMATMDARTRLMSKAFDQSMAWKKETADLKKELQADAGKSNRAALLAGIADDTERRMTEITLDAQDKIEDLRGKVAGATHQDLIEGIQKQITAELDRKKNNDQDRMISVQKRQALREELGRLQADKKILLAQQAETEAAIEKEKQAKLAEIRAQASDAESKKAAKDAVENARAGIEAQKQALQKQKSDLESAIGEGKEHDVHAVATQNMRFGGIVQLQPTANDPQVKAAMDAVAQLKIVNDQLKLLDASMKDIGKNDGGLAVNW